MVPVSGTSTPFTLQNSGSPIAPVVHSSTTALNPLKSMNVPALSIVPALFSQNGCGLVVFLMLTLQEFPATERRCSSSPTSMLVPCRTNANVRAAFPASHVGPALVIPKVLARVAPTPGCVLKKLGVLVGTCRNSVPPVLTLFPLPLVSCQSPVLPPPASV